MLAASLSCADTASPSRASVVGTYVLTSVDGRTLPTTIAVTGSVTRVAIADTLVFAEHDEGTHTRVFEHHTPDGVGPVTTRRSTFQYEVVDGKVLLAFVCEDPFSGRIVGCAAPPQMRGTITRRGINFDAAFFFQTPLRYQRR